MPGTAILHDAITVRLACLLYDDQLCIRLLFPILLLRATPPMSTNATTFQTKHTAQHSTDPISSRIDSLHLSPWHRCWRLSLQEFSLEAYSLFEKIL